VIFETLYESARQGELILIDGGFCRWHLRRDGIITIYEIISIRSGAGQEMLAMLRAHGKPIRAKCPADLASNEWYERQGFSWLARKKTRSGREINIWLFQP
jgi:hypothetical protein